jgi:hypothetical protein
MAAAASEVESPLMKAFNKTMNSEVSRQGVQEAREGEREFRNLLLHGETPKDTELDDFNDVAEFKTALEQIDSLRKVMSEGPVTEELLEGILDRWRTYEDAEPVEDIIAWIRSRRGAGAGASANTAANATTGGRRRRKTKHGRRGAAKRQNTRRRR